MQNTEALQRKQTLQNNNDDDDDDDDDDDNNNNNNNNNTNNTSNNNNNNNNNNNKNKNNIRPKWTLTLALSLSKVEANNTTIEKLTKRCLRL